MWDTMTEPWSPSRMMSRFRHKSRNSDHRLIIADYLHHRFLTSAILELQLLRGWPMSEEVTVMLVTREKCVMWGVAGTGGTLTLVDRRHRGVQLACGAAARGLYSVFLGTQGGNILAFWRPAPPRGEESGDTEMENR